MAAAAKVNTTTTIATAVSTVTSTGPFNATRNPQPPLQQPSYSFQHVPDATKDLQYSILYKISNQHRTIFQQSMAEMLLLCKEAVRRRRTRQLSQRQPPQQQENSSAVTNDKVHHTSRHKRRCSPRRTAVPTTGTLDRHCEPPHHSTTHPPPAGVVAGSGNKPLSLEYIADRLDIDDPCFGYIVRTHERNPSQCHDIDTLWQSGMLQGFITATTFTNWQKSFRWDSINEAAYYDDHDDHHDNDDHPNNHDTQGRPRVRDVDGSLARELQSTVHCGNIHGEGIVWPRIAEISLLGGLGCGATLLRTLIHELETSTKPTIMANYDYLVLQATDNSIPFYESMGFVRVGAIMLEEDQNNNSDESSESMNENIPAAEDDTHVTSPVFTYDVKGTGETLTRIAAKFHADVYDILFLNRDLLGMNARPCDKPKIHAKLLIPKNSQNSRNDDPTTSSHDENPLPYVPSNEIQWHICKENDTPRTIAKMYNVSTYDVVERNKGRLPGLISSSRLKENTKIKVSHLHVPDNLYKPYAHWSFPDSKYEDPEPSYMMVRKLHRRRKVPQTQHSMTKKQSSSSAVAAATSDDPSISFVASLKGMVVENDIPNPSLLLSPPSLKMPATTEVTSQQPSSILATATAPATTPYVPYSDNDPMIKGSLYNKVVRLKPGAMTEGSDYTYWYVLTYIPDLQWCHLAPMIQDGTFGMDKPKAFGKTKWRLLDENYGHEVDISSKYCIPVRSRSMKKTLDADKEEWDVIDDGTDPTAISSTYRRNSVNHVSSNSQRGTIAIKPSSERVRKLPPTTLSSPAPSTTSYIMESPSLLAAIPGTGRITMVRLEGRLLFKQPSTISTITIGPTVKETMNNTARKRGRPVGSKNVAKIPAIDEEDVVCSPIGKKRRLNAPIVHVPASARKAAAMRTTSTLDKPMQRQMIVNESNSNQTKGMNSKKSVLPAVQPTLPTEMVTRTLPPRRASLSSSTYTIDSPSSVGSTYHSDNNTADSDTVTVASLEDDTSDFEQTKPPTKRRTMSANHVSRRSSRLSSPSAQDRPVAGSLLAESATPKRRTTRSSATTSSDFTENAKVAETVDEDVMVARRTKRQISSTPPSRLPKLAYVREDGNKEMTLTIRSVDLTPSVYNERDQQAANGVATNINRARTSQAGRKLVQQNLNSMIVPKEKLKSRSHSATSSVASLAKKNSKVVSNSKRRTSTHIDATIVTALDENNITTDESYGSHSKQRPRRKSASYT